jgi:alpha-ketoglutarate-dependent taurine dioxygenase
MTRLTENDIRPIPDFAGEVSTAEVQDLANAVYALQRVVVFQDQEITKLKEAGNKGGTAKRSTSSAAKKTADE